MSSFRHLLVLLLLNFSHGSTRDPPKWNSYYYVEGDIFLPFSELYEPFQAWYDLESENSRIDYYNGMTKTYQLYYNESFGSFFKVFPVTTETEENTIVCLKTNGNNGIHNAPQSSLPDLKYFKFDSENVESGQIMEKWIKETIIRNELKTYTMWLYRKDDVIYPFKFQGNGHYSDSEYAFKFKNFIIIYKKFSTEKPDPNIFNIEESKCKSSPAPGIDLIYNFNPMMEFINNYEQHVDSAFDEFTQNYHKNYTKGTAEHFKRKNNFRQHLRFIQSKNRANLGYSLAVNHLADYSKEELKQMRGYRETNLGEYNGGIPFPYNQEDFKDIPPQFDWRIYGAVTPVKDQSICGSCWSFATTGTIEGAYFLKYGVRKSFSEQALIDCSWGYNNSGCYGGNSIRAYSWIEKHGLPTEEEYGPYLAQNGDCHITNISKRNLTKISGFVLVRPFNEDALKFALVNHGPISILIDASHDAFSFYTEGVYIEENLSNYTLKFNHGVLLMGYGTLNDKPYWLVKNSWSSHWGTDGYILISRKNNQNGVMSIPTYVIM